MDGRKYSNDDDAEDDILCVLRGAIMAPFYHDYRAAILHATRRRYSSLRFPRPSLPSRSSPCPSSPHFLTFASCIISARGTAILSSTIATLVPLVEYLHYHLTLDALLSSGGWLHPRSSKTAPADAIRICACIRDRGCTDRARRRFRRRSTSLSVLLPESRALRYVKRRPFSDQRTKTVVSSLGRPRVGDGQHHADRTRIEVRNSERD